MPISDTQSLIAEGSEILLRKPSQATILKLSAQPPHQLLLTNEPSQEEDFKVSYDDVLSTESASRYPSPLKDLATKYFNLPGMISFGGGLPHPETFPVDGITLSVPYSSEIVSVGVPLGKSTSQARRDGPLQIELSQALQYGSANGAPVLVNFLKEYTDSTTKIPYSDWSVTLTLGNTDGFDNVVRLLCNRGDSCLVEKFCYPATIAALVPQGIIPVPVSLDSEGMNPTELDQILSTWKKDEMGRKPRVVVVVPTGQNPTGGTMGIQRRKMFYAVARKHKLMIIVDDPYRDLTLHFPAIHGDDPPSTPSSFLDLDTDGRVISLSSFSKVVAPGCRTGWIVAPTPIVDRLVLRNQVTIQSVSGFSLLGVISFLGSLQNGIEGWNGYLKKTAEMYSVRATLQHNAYQKHLPIAEGLCSYNLPSAGMFIFIRIHAEHHHKLQILGAEGVLEDVFQACVEERILVAPSTLFKADVSRKAGVHEVSLRTSFSYVSVDQMEEGAKRLGRAIRRSFGLIK